MNPFLKSLCAIAVKLVSYTFAGAVLLVVSCTSSKPEILWVEGAEQDGLAIHEIRIQNARSLPQNWVIWFSQMPAGMESVEGSDAFVERYQGNLCRIIPSGTCRDTLVVRYSSNPLVRRSWAPEGFVLQDLDSKSVTGTPLDVKYDFLPMEPDGRQWYDYNEKLAAHPVKLYDIIPAPKHVCTITSQDSCPSVSSLYPFKDKPEGWYRLMIDQDGKVAIESEDKDGDFYANITLEHLRNNSADEPLKNILIEDWPDFRYRGFMLDVARNFTSPGNVKRLIDVLVRYKVNYLHLHLTDDEGWRIAIDGIPELTSVGAFHSLDWEHALQPSYDGCADPSSKSLSNGFFTREDFLDILKYAWERRIRVIPEVESPGHCRAAIYAMKAYEKRTGDTSMRLQDPADSSIYCGPQGYSDNVMSVELESVYTFVERIFDSLISMFDEAGVPLEAINIGGDEVPEGAWYGRPLHSTFLDRVAGIAKCKGVKIAGWQEIASRADESIAASLKETMFVNYVWNTAWGGHDLPFVNAARGYPTVMSNVEFTYADQAYSSSKLEIAHSWACYTDDTASLGLPVKKTENLVGVQAQMFTETVRSFDDICYDCFPKILGVFERGWNADLVRTSSDFYSSIVAYEMPWWEANDINFHIPQPGMIMESGIIKTNSAIPGAVIEISPDSLQATASYCSRRSCATTLAR